MLLALALANLSVGMAASHAPAESNCSMQGMAHLMAAAKRANSQPGAIPPKVLVTGAAGFIGSHVAETCAVRLGFTVIVIDDLSGGFTRNMRPWLQAPSFFVRGDVRNATLIEHVFAEHGPFAYVYHLAAYAAEGLSHFIRAYNYDNNLAASVVLLNAALNQVALKGTPVQRFVFTSSIAAFGAVLDPSELPMTEDTPQRPEDPYGIAKHSMELDLKAAHHMFGQSYTIFRPHNVYGPRQNIADKFRNAIGIFMNQILHNEPITIFGDGEQTRGFSYIEDVAPVIAASVLYPTAAQQDFFVGTDQKYSINVLAQMTKAAMGVEGHPVQHLEARKEVADAFASHSKLRCFFRPWEPATLEAGLAVTAAYVKKHYAQGGFEPSGYTAIEVGRNMPPSWQAWMSATNPHRRQYQPQTLRSSSATPLAKVTKYGGAYHKGMPKMHDICTYRVGDGAIADSAVDSCREWMTVPVHPPPAPFPGLFPPVRKELAGGEPPKMTIFLTATIDVGKTPLVRQGNAQDRIKLYQASLSQWEKLPYENVLFHENTGWVQKHGNPFKLSSNTNVKIISVDLPRNESRGKNVNEAKTFNHAISTGLLGGQNDWVVKITARYAPYERMWEMDAAIREGRWDVISVGSDTRRVAGTVKFMKAFADYCEEHCNDNPAFGPRMIIEEALQNMKYKGRGWRNKRLLETVQVLPTRSGSGNIPVENINGLSLNVTTPECPYGGACELDLRGLTLPANCHPNCKVFANGNYRCHIVGPGSGPQGTWLCTEKVKCVKTKLHTYYEYKPESTLS